MVSTVPVLVTGRASMILVMLVGAGAPGSVLGYAGAFFWMTLVAARRDSPGRNGGHGSRFTTSTAGRRLDRRAG